MGRFLTIAVLTACATAGSGTRGVSAQAGSLQLNRIFGPEVPTGRYKHPACLTELRNGDLYLVYYGGAGEYAVDTSVFGSRLRKGSTDLERAGLSRTRPVPLARQRRHLAGTGRRRLGFLRRALR